jgi:hypothetical protein
MSRSELYMALTGRRGRDRMVVGFTTTYAISAYHHWCCDFESRSWRGVQHYVIKFVSDLWQVGGFIRVLRFPPRYNWNIVESGVKHHQVNKHAWSYSIHTGSTLSINTDTIFPLQYASPTTGNTSVVGEKAIILLTQRAKLNWLSLSSYCRSGCM